MKKNIPCAFAVLLLFIMGAFGYKTEKKVTSLEEDMYRVKQENQLKDAEIDSLKNELDSLHDLSWEAISYWLEYYDVKHRDVVKRQIMLETGNLTSRICIENRNLFGMREPRVRETTALGTKNHHAYYASYHASIRDYALWQSYSYKGGDYYAFLSSVGYATAPHYIQTLKRL